MEGRYVKYMNSINIQFIEFRVKLIGPDFDFTQQMY